MVERQDLLLREVRIDERLPPLLVVGARAGDGHVGRHCIDCVGVVLQFPNVLIQAVAAAGLHIVEHEAVGLIAHGDAQQPVAEDRRGVLGHVRSPGRVVVAQIHREADPGVAGLQQGLEPDQVCRAHGLDRVRLVALVVGGDGLAAGGPEEAPVHGVAAEAQDRLVDLLEQLDHRRVVAAEVGIGQIRGLQGNSRHALVQGSAHEVAGDIDLEGLNLFQRRPGRRTRLRVIGDGRSHLGRGGRRG